MHEIALQILCNSIDAKRTLTPAEITVACCVEGNLRSIKTRIFCGYESRGLSYVVGFSFLSAPMLFYFLFFRFHFTI